ncbi:hypothetical protein JCM11641_008448 [Rhodosporidiobolus odoratus]
MSDRVGYWWPPQQGFAECSGGLSIVRRPGALYPTQASVSRADVALANVAALQSEWCLEARDTCCGLCPNAPITGPGTIIVFTCGTLLNLWLVTFWKAEAPYNLLFQLLATDGAFVALANRVYESENRLSQFHACLVPLAIMSVVPIIVSACTVEVTYFHSISTSRARALLEKKLEKARMQAAQQAQRPSFPSHPGSNMYSVRKHSKEKKKQQGRRKQGRDIEKQEGRRKSSTKYDRTPASKEHLAASATIILAVHLVMWPILFFIVFTTYHKNASQMNCADEYNFRRYTIMCAIMTGFLYLIAGFFFAIVVLGYTSQFRGQPGPQDALTFFTQVLHLHTIEKMVRPAVQGDNSTREAVRRILSLIVYAIWAACYLTVYFLGLNEFIMFGDNPFDFGQVAACFSTLTPLIVVGRAAMVYYDDWKVNHDKTETNTIEPSRHTSAASFSREPPEDAAARAAYEQTIADNTSEGPKRSSSVPILSAPILSAPTHPPPGSPNRPHAHDSPPHRGRSLREKPLSRGRPGDRKPRAPPEHPSPTRMPNFSRPFGDARDYPPSQEDLYPSGPLRHADDPAPTTDVRPAGDPGLSEDVLRSRSPNPYDDFDLNAPHLFRPGRDAKFLGGSSSEEALPHAMSGALQEGDRPYSASPRAPWSRRRSKSPARRGNEQV